MIFYIFLLGAAIGSFINMLIVRLPAEQSIMGRSHCDHCKHQLSWQDLVPIFSYLTLGGKCRYCKKKIPSVNLLVEIVTATLFVLSWTYLGVTVTEKILYLGIISASLVIFFADARTQIIPDSMQVSLMILSTGLLLTRQQSIIAALQQGIIIALPILLLYLITKGRGMGFGDVKLAFVIGYMFGWLLGIAILYVAFISGAIVGVYLLATKRKKMKQTIAFGPFLVLGMFAALFFQEQILSVIYRLYPH